jgi:hypothetical protein
MRTLSSTLDILVGVPITTPGYFLRIAFATPLYLSSRGELPWNGQTWSAGSFTISGLAIDGSQSAQDGTLVLTDTDFSITQRILTEGLADKRIDIWAFYSDVPLDPPDAVLVFSGVADDVDMEPASARVTVNLQQESARNLFCPRHYITREQGFSMLPASGMQINFDGKTYILGSRNV